MIILKKNVEFFPTLFRTWTLHWKLGYWRAAASWRDRHADY
jgi:hypothetical protein